MNAQLRQNLKPKGVTELKILQINCVYNTGSTGKIVKDIHNELLQRGIESVVCYGRGKKVAEAGVYKTCGELYSKLNNLRSRLTGIMYGGCEVSTHRLISIIKKEKPDVVHLHCINGYFVNIYRLLEFLKKSKIKTVLTLHAEFMYTANCGHAFDCERWKDGCSQCPRLKKETKSLLFDRTHISWLRMKRAFAGFDQLVVTSVSPWLMERAKQSPILADKEHCVVLNGLDTEVFHWYDAQDLKKKHEIGDAAVVFHATPYFTNDPSHIKGGHYVLELAKRLPDVKFVIAGDHAENLSVPENVILLGRINDQRLLARYYSMADVTLLTSKKETFSMVCAESLCCGTPVVGFQAGGPEAISLPAYSRFVDYGDIDQMHSVVVGTLDKRQQRDVICLDAAGKYSKSQMANGYLDVYYSLLTGECRR